MRKILTPNRSWLIHNMYEKSAVLSQGDDITPGTAYLFGFEDAITYANTILETTEEHKRPFLSDAQIFAMVSEISGESYDNLLGRREGAHWARDRYEEMLSASTTEPLEQWKPQDGHLVAGWGHNYYTEENGRVIIGYYRGQREAESYHEIEDLNSNDIHHRSFVAVIESSDEIGKPPSYFQERGRCTVSNNQKLGG